MFHVLCDGVRDQPGAGRAVYLASVLLSGMYQPTCINRSAFFHEFFLMSLTLTYCLPLLICKLHSNGEMAGSQHAPPGRSLVQPQCACTAASELLTSAPWEPVLPTTGQASVQCLLPLVSRSPLICRVTEVCTDPRPSGSCPRALDVQLGSPVMPSSDPQLQKDSLHLHFLNVFILFNLHY